MTKNNINMIKECPCGSQLNYQECCQKIHISHQAAKTPEMLMRARFSAHALGLLDFIVNTYHPDCKAFSHRKAIADSLHHTKWLNLQIISAEIDSTKNQGFVEFKAFYIEDKKPGCLHERSRFILENKDNISLWYYIDGVFPGQNEKIGRNDPCFCGSGKKYKKCCSKS